MNADAQSWFCIFTVNSGYTTDRIMLCNIVEKWYIRHLLIFFWDEPFLSSLFEIYLSIKYLENLAKFKILQNLHQWYIRHLLIFFWDEPFLSSLFEIYLSVKYLENLAKFKILQNLHLHVYTQKSICAINFGPFGEIGANISIQLSFLTLKINVKDINIEFSQQVE